MAEITAPDLNKEIEYVKRYWTGRDELIVQGRRHVRFRRYRPVIPEAYQVDGIVQVKPAHTSNEIKRIVGYFARNDPVVHQPPMADTEKERARSSKVERWTNAWLRALDKQMQTSLLYDMLDTAATDGDCYLLCGLSPDEEEMQRFRQRAGSTSKETDEALRRLPLPHFIRIPDTTAVKPLRDVDKRVLIIERVPAMDMYDEYGAERVRAVLREAWEQGFSDLDPPTIGTLTDLERTIRYDREHEIVALNGAIIESRKHGYDRPPVFRMPGKTTASKDPREATESVVEDILDQELLQAHFWSIMATVAWFKGFPIWVSIQEDGQLVLDDDGRPRVWTPKHGQMEQVQGKPFNLTESMGLGPELGALLSGSQGMIDRFGLSPVASGISPGADSPGYAINSLLHAALARDWDLLRKAERCLEQVVVWGWKTIEHNLGYKVYVDAPAAGNPKVLEQLALSPEDIRGYYAVRVTVDPLLPQNKAQEHQLAMDKYERGFTTWVQTAEEMGDESPEETRFQRRAEDLFEKSIRPVVERWVIQDLLPEMGPKPQTGLVDQFGNPLSGGATFQAEGLSDLVGGTQPNPPSVGVENLGQAGLPDLPHRQPEPAVPGPVGSIEGT